MADEKKVVLLDTSSNKHHDFSAAHAAALLAYPGTLWAPMKAEKAAAEETVTPKKK